MKAKKRHILQKEWTFVRADIERARSLLNFGNEEFKALNINEWKKVQTKIEDSFLYKRSANAQIPWLWEDLKVESFGISCQNDPYQKLNLLINENEVVYLIVNERVNKSTKYWLYEGKIEAIISIIGEISFDEYYLVSKKYDWFLCTNHHQTLMGAGNIISSMKKNEQMFLWYK